VEWGILTPSPAQPTASWECLATSLQQCNASQTVEFSLDSITLLQHKGFSIEPTRGSVERGQTKTISISWMPPTDFDVGAGGTPGWACDTPAPPQGRVAMEPVGQGSEKDHGSAPGACRLRVPLLPPAPAPAGPSTHGVSSAAGQGRRKRDLQDHLCSPCGDWSLGHRSLSTEPLRPSCPPSKPCPGCGPGQTPLYPEAWDLGVPCRIGSNRQPSVRTQAQNSALHGHD
jgi:hypothetical protein